jgi:RsiW-degrading membrane proteinase PrsW (M82 family)
MNTSQPSKFWAYVAVVVGVLLLLGGLAALSGYLGLPLAALRFNIIALEEDILGLSLGQMAGMFLGLVCGTLALYHGLGSILNHPSRPLRLPPAYFFWITFALVLGLGNALLIFEVAERFLFPPLFMLGAALPTLAVLAWVARRLGWPASWRQGALALVAGSTLSVIVTVVLEGILPFLAYLLIGPLGFLAYGWEGLSYNQPGVLERLFFSPLLIVFLITTALAAPIPEELAKALGLSLFGRQRLTNERQAFLVGLACGAGFAILENMLYEGVYAQYGGWSWGGITLLRGIGAVLHPLCTGLVALGWFRVGAGGTGKLLRAYLVAVGLHTLWNGGFELFVFITGLNYYGGLQPSFNFYGLAVAAVLVVFLVVLSLGLWWLLYRLVTGLGQGVEPDLAPTVVTSRALAGWALACALVIIPLGAALGLAWRQIQGVILSGPK